jgi:acetylornithine deacetylase/succinyl-diaminopimelate desuccinylase-like protein
VPAAAELTVDWRTLPGPGDDADALDARLEAVLSDVEQRHGVETEHDRWLFARPAEVPADHRLVETLTTAARENGLPGETVGFNACTDARHFINGGDVPTVLFGPGSIFADAHTADESIDRDALDATARTYRSVLESFFES